MDALIRFLVGAAALCAASIAYAEPVVVDGDPDEPDIGGGVAEPVIPHHARSLNQSTIPHERILVSNESASKIRLKCEMKKSLLSSDFSKSVPLGREDPWLVSIDISGKSYNINKGYENTDGLFSNINHSHIYLKKKNGPDIDVNREDGTVSSVFKWNDGDYYLEQGNCEKVTSRSNNVENPTKF